MREIRFRAWDNQEKEMLYSDPELSADFNIFVGWWNNETDKSRIILMQYTGLKEIYEGDILKFKNINWEVFWGELKHNWMMRSKHSFGNTTNHRIYRQLFWIANKDFEVIGNIYENPELLQGGKE